MDEGKRSTSAGPVWAAALLLACPACVIDRGGTYIPDGWPFDPQPEEIEAAVEIEDEATPEPGETCATLGPDICEDGLDCTDNTCRDTAGGPVCDRVIAAGSCLIGGACLPAGQEETGNSCRLCDPAVSNQDWTPRPDSTACVEGICCGGVCRAGECCVDGDCEGCVGNPDPCPEAPSENDCWLQGCDWTPEGICEGGGSCSTWDDDYEVCIDCGCSWLGARQCRGEVPCADFSDFAACEAKSGCGCTWTSTGGTCSGTSMPCSGTSLEGECADRDGCDWVTGATCDTGTFLCRF